VAQGLGEDAERGHRRRGQAERVAKNDAPEVPQGRLGVAVRPLTKDERGENGSRERLVVEQVSGAAERAGVQPATCCSR
jgi:hypothetical protein